MAGETGDFGIVASLNIAATLRNVENDLKKIESQLKPIQISAQLNTENIKSQTAQVQQQIKQTVAGFSNNVKPISLDNVFNFDTHNMSKLMEQLTEYKNELNKLSDIAPAKLTTHTNALGNIDSAKFTYFNDQLKSSVTETFELDKASKEAANSVNRLALTGTTYNTNAYSSAQQTEKLNQQLQALKTNLNSFGSKNVGALLDNNSLGKQYQTLLDGLNSVNDDTGLTNLKNQFSELQTQTNEYINTEKVLKAESDNAFRSQAQDLETIIKSEAQRAESVQRTTNRISELNAQYSKFQAQLSKNDKGISLGSLNQENVSGLQNALNTNNIQQATHYLRLLKTEYSELNEAMDKPFSSNALEKLETRAEKLSRNIDVITSKFSQVHLDNQPGFANQVNQTTVNVQKLQENLDKFNNTEVGQDKVSAFNALNKSVAETKNQVNDLYKSQKALEQLQGVSGSFEGYLKTNPKVASQFKNEISDVQGYIKSLSQETDMTKLTSGLGDVRARISSIRGEAKALGLEGRTVFGELGNDIKKLATWGLGTAILYGGMNEIKQMAQNVKSLDEALVNIQMATGDTREAASKLMDTYNQMGRELGATTVEVSQSADSFLRQGKSLSDTNTLIKDSMVLSKVGEIDSAQATEYLTSSMKGYGVTVNDAIGIVDKLSKVDIESATSAGGLAEAMSKVASVANISGVSMDKLIGYLATVGEVTQKSMDEVGTSFQAIFSRMGNVKAGKFVDDETGESLNDVESVLGKVGIQLRDSQGQFRNFGTVLDEIGAKWKSYNSVEQNAITTAIAGKLALCSNIQQCIALAA